MTVIRIPSYNTLTRHLVLSGLNPAQAGTIANLFLTWCRKSGPEWTNSRWKDLRQWYEAYLAADCEMSRCSFRPTYFARNKQGFPKGILSVLFKLRPDKALLALSINTFLVAEGMIPSQRLKFQAGLKGNGCVYTPDLKAQLLNDLHRVRIPRKRRPKSFNGEIRLPDLADFGNKSTISVGDTTIKLPKRVDGNSRVVSEKLAQSLVEAWRSTPEVTMEFLWDSGHLDYIPWDVLAPGGYQLDLNSFQSSVGVVGHIQEPELKARNIHNSHLVTQVTLEPLGRLWYSMLASIGYDLTGNIHQSFGRDCFLNQEAGVAWVQSQLAKGVCLAGADLSSATDLLSLDACIDIVNEVFFPELRSQKEYMRHVQYFCDCSRSPVWDPDVKKFIRWEQGQPLGLYPSFALLGLTNNALCMLACRKAGLPTNSYCVLGDDTIMDARAGEYYTQLVESIGGSINHTKTLTSKHIAEFAGRVVTPNDVFRKRIKFTRDGVSDDSFLEFMRTVGAPGVPLLRTRQRRLWDIFRFVPGIIVPGPWSLHSQGKPLHLRYEWYLTHVAQDRLELDQEEPLDPEFAQLEIAYLLGEDSINGVLPAPLDTLPYQGTGRVDRTMTGDPRKWLRGGKSMAEVLTTKVKDPSFVKYDVFEAREIASLNTANKQLSSASESDSVQA